MRSTLIILGIILSSFTSKANIHIVNVWDGYFQFLDADITIQLGDTVQWLPLDLPSMIHTITSTDIPSGATPFDQIWQTPADTFFQYVPQFIGLYQYECTPHAVQYGMVGSITVTGGTTSIDENELRERVGVYPNPATKFIHFIETNTIAAYNIYTASGEIVLNGTTNDKVDISTLTTGTYFVEIIGDKPRIVKFIKQ